MRGVFVMGQVLSQSEIDNLLVSLLKDATVLPVKDETSDTATTEKSPNIELPTGLAAFKARCEAMKATT